MKPTILQAALAIAAYERARHIEPFAGRMADAYLMDLTGCTEHESWEALMDAADADAISYGNSTRTGWLTERGEQLVSTGTLPPDHSVLDGLASLRP